MCVCASCPSLRSHWHSLAMVGYCHFHIFTFSLFNFLTVAHTIRVSNANRRRNIFENTYMIANRDQIGSKQRAEKLIPGAHLQLVEPTDFHQHPYAANCKIFRTKAKIPSQIHGVRSDGVASLHCVRSVRPINSNYECSAQRAYIQLNKRLQN